MRGYPERDGDFLVREVPRNQVKDLDLSSTEASRRSVVVVEMLTTRAEDQLNKPGTGVDPMLTGVEHEEHPGLRRWRESGAPSDSPGRLRISSTEATAWDSRLSSRTGSGGDQQTPSRVLRAPPILVRVRSRVPPTIWRSSPSSRARPMKRLSSTGRLCSAPTPGASFTRNRQPDSRRFLGPRKTKGFVLEWLRRMTRSANSPQGVTISADWLRRPC